MRIIPVLVLCGCSSAAKPVPATPTPTPATTPTTFTTSKIALPGGSADGVGMDYLLFDARTKTVWVPAGNTGSVDVIEANAAHKLTRIEGFATQEMERRGKKRTVGPSSATLGDHVVYVGNRGDSSICAVDDTTLAKGACGKLDAMPDGIAYVPSTHEVWVTSPRDNTIRILDGKTLEQKAKLPFEGNPEGFAVDTKRGRFYTNLEDKDVTLAIDLTSHAIVATWKPNCGEDGPHGLRVDEDAGFLFVACSAKVETMDVGHDGAILGSLDTGDGVDDLDFANHQVFVGAAHAAKLTIGAVDAKGALSLVASVPTVEGARNGVADDQGRVYLSHAQGSEIVVASPSK